MFKLLIEFLCFIITNLEACLSTDSPSEESLKPIYEIYTLLNRLDKATRAFAHVLAVWRRDFYHGSAWSAAHSHLATMQKIMSLLGADLDQLIQLQNPGHDSVRDKELRYQFRGHPGHSTTDVFSLWQQILWRNSEHQICGWISHYSATQGTTLNAFGEHKFFPDVQSRCIFIPAYSLLLPQVTRTSDLENLLDSQWLEDITALGFSQTPYGKQMNWYPTTLEFLPEFPGSSAIEAGVTQLKQQSYALKVEVPQEDALMGEIILMIEQHALVLNQSVSQLKHTLKASIHHSIDIIF